MYNDCFGGFSFNKNFCRELFRQFPPTTTVGKDLFPETTLSEYNQQNALHYFFGDYSFVDDTHYIYEQSTNKYYYLSRHMDNHRANKHIISFLFDRLDLISEDEFNERYDDILKSSSNFELEQIVTEDGQKKYTQKNWRDSSVLISQMPTYDIGGSFSAIRIDTVKPELTWRIHEYDGSETVIAKFDYYKIIGELVRELQINKIQPSSDCSDLVAKVIRGEMTMAELKTFENS